MSDKLDAIRDARARGEILKLIRTRHRGQQSRMDHVELWHMLRGIGIDVGENDVMTYLQDLEMLNAIKFASEKDRKTNRVSITMIELCSYGLRLIDGRAVDETVLF